MIVFNQQHRLSGLPHISFSTIPTFLNQATFNMDPADMTREQILQHLQDERRTRQEQADKNRRLTGRRYPTLLWADFRRLHQIAFKHVSNQLVRPGAEAIESREVYQATAKHIVRNCPLKDEAAVAAYQERAVEEAVIDAWERVGNGQIRLKSREDHPLHDIDNRVRQMNTGSEATVQPTTPTKRQYDKVYYITTRQGASRDLFVIEYKAADKLTPEVVKEGLRDMEIASIKERITVSTEKKRAGGRRWLRRP